MFPQSMMISTPNDRRASGTCANSSRLNTNTKCTSSPLPWLTRLRIAVTALLMRGGHVVMLTIMVLLVIFLGKACPHVGRQA